MSHSAARGRTTRVLERQPHWIGVRFELQRVTPMFPSAPPVATELKNAEVRTEHAQTTILQLSDSLDGDSRERHPETGH